MTERPKRRRDMAHAGKHPLSRSQVDALLAIAAAGGILRDARLRREIGAYATNVIKSLETDRGMIVEQIALFEGERAGWMLTERGRQAVQDLATDRTPDRTPDRAPAPA